MPLKIGSETAAHLKIGSELVGVAKIGGEIAYRRAVAPPPPPSNNFWGRLVADGALAVDVSGADVPQGQWIKIYDFNSSQGVRNRFNPSTMFTDTTMQWLARIRTHSSLTRIDFHNQGSNVNWVNDSIPSWTTSTSVYFVNLTLQRYFIGRALNTATQGSSFISWNFDDGNFELSHSSNWNGLANSQADDRWIFAIASNPNIPVDYETS